MNRKITLIEAKEMLAWLTDDEIGELWVWLNEKLGDKSECKRRHRHYRCREKAKAAA